MNRLISTVAIVAAMGFASGAVAQTTSTQSGANGTAGATTGMGADVSSSIEMGTSASAETGASTSVEQGGGTSSMMSGGTSSAEQGGASASASGASTTTTSSGGVSITDEQKTEIHQAITQINVQPVTVNFDVNVGVVVPTTVVLTPLPEKIVTILPRYKGFLFFLLPDGRIVIVEPKSHKIVVIIVL